MNDTIKKIIHEHQEESHQLSFYFDFDQDNHHIRFSANASRLTIVSLLQDLIHSILRKQNTTTRRIYITTMYRYANRESHSYVTYAGFSRETAIQRGWEVLPGSSFVYSRNRRVQENRASTSRGVV